MEFSQYKFNPNSTLDSYLTQTDGGCTEDQLKDLRSDLWKQIAKLQERLFAESEQSLLIVLQAMDAAGKDSTIGKLTKNLNAQGCLVHSFKKPSKLEMQHDFLWRIHAKVPRKGDITLFNRSHYEDVLIVKVHGWASDDQIKHRYRQINDFEHLLSDRGTKVIKFMLHVSPEYQLSRFKSRLENPAKNWKFNPGDLNERGFWDDYMQAFEQAMQFCGPDSAPWYVVPAENRLFRDVMIASLVKDQLESMNPQYPEPEFDTSLYTPHSLV